MILCAIHQPNFFPWLGYFDKIRQADIFIFLDDVAYPKSGSGTGSWTNRVQIAISGEASWIGCPLRRWHGVRGIKDVQIDDRQPWRKKMLRTLEVNYRRSSNYQDVMHVLQRLIMYETDNLATYNMYAINSLCHFMKIKANFLLQSEQGGKGSSTTLLVDLVKKARADSYLCGGGASGYQDDTLFEKHGIKLVYQNFVPPVYANEKEYLPGLSVIDFLMRATPETYSTLGQQIEVKEMR